MYSVSGSSGTTSCTSSGNSTLSDCPANLESGSGSDTVLSTVSCSSDSSLGSGLSTLEKVLVLPFSICCFALSSVV